jgi:hemerythrin-like domain-containing protein
MSESATSRLRAEHQLILQVADALETLVARSESGDSDFDALADCISFIRLFADACHHGKEEDLLFPALEARGMPHDQGPIAVMLFEHQQGRAFAKAMAAALDEARAGDEEALTKLRSAATGYVHLIRGHINKEDHVLFEMADQAVQGPACQRLCDEYGLVCQRVFEGRTKEQLEELAASLKERAVRR